MYTFINFTSGRETFRQRQSTFRVTVGTTVNFCQISVRLGDLP